MDKPHLAPHPDSCGAPSEEDMADLVASTMPQLSLIKALIRQGVTPTVYRMEYERHADDVLKEQIKEAKYKA